MLRGTLTSQKGSSRVAENVNQNPTDDPHAFRDVLSRNLVGLVQLRPTKQGHIVNGFVVKLTKFPDMECRTWWEEQAFQIECLN